jgi:hypothetical protein
VSEESELFDLASVKGKVPIHVNCCHTTRAKFKARHSKKWRKKEKTTNIHHMTNIFVFEIDKEILEIFDFTFSRIKKFVVFKKAITMMMMNNFKLYPNMMMRKK